MRSQDNVVAVMTKLWDGQLRICGLIPRKEQEIFLFSKPSSSLLFNRWWGTLPKGKAVGALSCSHILIKF
jgi:hypothetical protein